MTSKKITTTLGTVQNSIESAWNRIVMGVRTRRMPKTIKRVKKTLQGNKSNGYPFTSQNQSEREFELYNKTVFYAKYIGSTLIEELVDSEPGANYYNTGFSTKALDRIIRMSRNRTLVSASITISPNGIQVMRQTDRSIILDVSMDRVSFCSNDKKYSKVTSFIAKNYVNETMECYAFLCERHMMAKAITDALALAHNKSKEAANGDTVIEESSEADNFHRDIYPSTDSSTASTYAESNVKTHTLIDCENNESERVQLRPKADRITQPISHEDSHNLVSLMDTKTEGRQANSLPFIEDDDLQPVMRQRADSDSWAVMATAPNDSASNDLELEFSNFARSRSTTNLADLHTSMHSAWDI